MTSITIKSPKEEIITSSLELIDSLSETNKKLKEDRFALFVAVAVLFTTTFLF